MSIAERQADADYEYDLTIVQKALIVDQKKTTLLSREEAFILGHILQFSLEDMEWFLLRVCDVEGGFRYNSSNDLTLTNLTAFLTSAEISSRSLTFSLGIITVSQPALYAAIDFSFKPPIGSALPFRLISPVIAMFDLIKIPVSSLTIAVVIAKPADGPSFGIAASGA